MSDPTIRFSANKFWMNWQSLGRAHELDNLMHAGFKKWPAAFSTDYMKVTELAPLEKWASELRQLDAQTLIVIGIAMTSGLLAGPVGNFMLLATTLSMFITPLAARAGRALHRHIDSIGSELPSTEGLPDSEGVVIIAGFQGQTADGADLEDGST